MKKIYLSSLLCCLCIAAGAQVTTTIYASSGGGTFKTGYATSTTRTDDNILTNGTTEAGYAVFDLSSIPAGSSISTVTIGVYINSILGAGVPGPCNTYVYPGDLSTVTIPGTLYADLTSGTLLSTATYGTVTGDFTMAPTYTTPIAQALGGKMSICFTGGAPRTYTILGEIYALSTVGVHCPYITITYCAPATGVTATASPTTLCSGATLTLTGAATGATGGYLWSGPGGFTASTATATSTVSVASSGVYNLGAISVCTGFNDTFYVPTTAVTVNPLPTPITGGNVVCTGNAVTLSSTPTGGNWTSSSGGAPVGLTSGIVTGNFATTATITYTLGTGCFITTTMTVNNAPGSISGSNQVCVGSTVNLFDFPFGGTWTSSAPGTASVGSSTGVVTGVTTGVGTIISYATPGCAAVNFPMTVNPVPNAISGASTVCAGSSTTLTETTPGGNWTSSSGIRASVTGGVVTGNSAGAVNILYTLPGTGCQAIMPMTVNALPLPIGGPSDVCAGGGIITVTDGSAGGTFSGGAPNASVLGTTVTGITAGAAIITYTLPTTCAVTENILVDPAPSPITGTLSICQNSTTALMDPDGGGTWSSTATGTATVGTFSGVVTGVAAGTANISYTMPSGCGTVAAVVVNPLPSTTVTASGPTTFCTGNSVLLTAPAGGGNTYQWNNGGTPIAGETNSTYLASSSGAITVTVTNPFNCSATSSVVTVTDGFVATITSPTPLNFCIGGDVTLTANTGTAVGVFAYQWLLNGVPIAGATGPTLTTNTSGVYTCAVVVVGGSGVCTDTTAPANVLVNPIPTPTITTSGNALVTIGLYTTYQWYVNGVGVAGANSSSYVPVANGLYRVRAGDAIGCAGYSNQIEVTGVGVPQVNIAGTEIFPNPATDMVHIKSPLTLRAEITGADGKMLINVPDAKDINISNLASGLYIIMLYDENGTRLMVQKLVKE